MRQPVPSGVMAARRPTAHHTSQSDDVAGGVRRAVLDAAIRVIAERGPDAVSMRDIARTAGVSHQAPYHYFGDRAGVFAAIAEEGFAHLERDIAALAGDDVRRDAVVGTLIRRYVQFALDHVGEFRVMFRSELSGLTTNAGTRAAGDRCYDAVARVMAGGSIRGLEIDEAVVLVWAQAHGLATLLIDGPLRGRMPAGRSLDDLIATAEHQLRRAR